MHMHCTPMHIHEQHSKHVISTKTKNLMFQSYVHLVLVNFPTFFTSKLAHLTCFEWHAVVYALWQEGPKLVYAFWTLQPVVHITRFLAFAQSKLRPFVAITWDRSGGGGC